MLNKTLAGPKIGSLCWCEAVEVLIPVDWVKQGRTASCARDACWEGCEPVGHEDAFEVHFPEGESHPVPVATEGRGLVLEWGPGLCRCGCGMQVKGLFKQGHDQRMTGALVRALRAGELLTIIEPGTGTIVETDLPPLVWVERFNDSKRTRVDWVDKIKSRV